MSNNKIILKNIYDIYLSIKDKNIDKLIRYIEELIKNKNNKYKYLNELLNPEVYKFVKIPNPMPVASSSFQLYNSIKVEPNSDGCFALIINPFFLYNNNINGITDGNINDDTIFNLNNNKVKWGDIKDISDPTHKYEYWYSFEYMSTCLFNNDSSWDGERWEVTWDTINFNQNIPPIYNQYRLVSACIKVKYIGNIHDASGIIGGSIILESNNKLFPKYNYIRYDNNDKPYYSGANSYTDDTEKYSFFKNIKSAYYHQENSCLDGLKMVYFPTDNSCEQFYHLFDMNDFTYDWNMLDGKSCFFGKNYNDKLKFYVYAMNGTVDTKYKIDLYLNFECLPNAEYLNYIPINTELDNITNKEKKEMINILQQKPIMKFDENITYDDKNDWENNIKDIMK